MVKRSRVALEKLIGAIIVVSVFLGTIALGVLGLMIAWYGMMQLRAMIPSEYWLLIGLGMVCAVILFAGYCYFYFTTTDKELTT